jgi:bifunctional non-homologous end joining protein LigD
MRSLTELVAQATELGISVDGKRREDLMDAIRDAIGGFDPALQIDPMKAKDSKQDVEKLGLTAALAKIMAGGEWVMEPKLDGARARMFLGADGNKIVTGRRSVKTFAYIQREDNFPHLRDAVVPALAGTVLDGELLAVNPHSGEHLLNDTVALTNSRPEVAVKAQQERGISVNFHAFDVLSLHGEDVTASPLDTRRSHLCEMVERFGFSWLGEFVNAVPQAPAEESYIAECLADGYEGVMVKRLDSIYRPGKRSADWIKVKPFSTFDAFVTGYVPGTGRNTGLVGALKMSVLGEDGPIEVCQHGAFTDDMRRDLTAPDGSLKAEWHGYVMELQGQGVTKGNRVRHPHLVRLRPDKDAVDCDMAQLDALPKC